MQINMVDYSEVEHYKREIEERARQDRSQETPGGCPREGTTWSSHDWVLVSAQERNQERDRCRKAKVIYRK